MRVTQFSDALDVLGLYGKDERELSPTERSVLAELALIETRSQLEHKAAMVIKSLGDKEPFYLGPSTASNPRPQSSWYTGPAVACPIVGKSQSSGFSVHDVCRASVGLGRSPTSSAGFGTHEKGFTVAEVCRPWLQRRAAGRSSGYPLL